MNDRLEESKRRLRELAASELAGYRTEIDIVLDAVDELEKDMERLRNDLNSMQTAFDLQQGIISDQTSRITGLEEAIEKFLDPGSGRDGTIELQLALELGDDGEM